MTRVENFLHRLYCFCGFKLFYLMSKEDGRWRGKFVDAEKNSYNLVFVILLKILYQFYDNIRNSRYNNNFQLLSSILQPNILNLLFKIYGFYKG